jgi:Ser/Thr protein kinase RdoA (MazF antagonist)
VHLFERRPGAPATALDAAAALVHLKRLHGMLAQLPDGGGDGLEWLRERLRQVRAGAPLPGPGKSMERALDRIERLLEIKIEGSQWLHGDYHLGNLLVEDGRISGVVDFDDTGRGSAKIEAAFAAFAVSRDETCEEAFRYDARIFDEARAAYGEIDRELEPLFWADQVLIHLRAAQKGLWQLGPGIGFLGPYCSLMQ